MSKIFSIIKWFLIVWGGVSLIGALILGGYFAYHIGLGNDPKTDTASSQDVRFVLNRCNLGEERIEKVLKSHESSHPFLKDHLNAYAIKVKHVSVDELNANPGDLRRRWYHGDKLPNVLDDAISFVGSWLEGDEISWFPDEAELRSNEIYIYPWSINYHGTYPSSVELIFVRPKDKMVFFFSGST